MTTSLAPHVGQCGAFACAIKPTIPIATPRGPQMLKYIPPIFSEFGLNQDW
jgi:hypothetical protein